jgi:hypothetical protein
VAEKLFIEPENEDEMRRLVLVQLARMAVRGDWDGFLTGGSTGAPTDAQYVVMSLNGTLTDERVLAAGTGISLTDGGAGSNATIANTGVTSNVAGTGISVSAATGASTITNTGVTSNVAGTGISVSAATGASTITNTGVTSLVAGTNITLNPVSGVGDVTVTAATPTGLAPDDASYLTLGLDGDLTNERVLAAGTGISLTDGGAGSNATIANTGVTSIVAGDAVVLPSGGTGDVTVSVPAIADLITPSYVTLGTDSTLQNERVLTAGTGITLTDGGAGSTITIAASGGGGSGYQPVLPERDGSFPASNRELYLVSCMPPWGNTASGSTTATTALNSPYFRPFISPVTGTVTEIQVNVNSAADTPDYTLGIYSDSGGLPNTKIAEGTVSIVTTGMLALSTFTGTPALTAGTQYHFAWVRKDTSGAGNFTGEAPGSCFKYSPVGQQYPSLTNVGDTGVVIALSGSNNVLPATVSTGNLNPFSNAPIRFGLRWD